MAMGTGTIMAMAEVTATAKIMDTGKLKETDISLSPLQILGWLTVQAESSCRVAYDTSIASKTLLHRVK